MSPELFSANLVSLYPRCFANNNNMLIPVDPQACSGVNVGSKCSIRSQVLRSICCALWYGWKWLKSLLTTNKVSLERHKGSINLANLAGDTLLVNMGNRLKLRSTVWRKGSCTSRLCSNAWVCSESSKSSISLRVAIICVFNVTLPSGVENCDVVGKAQPWKKYRWLGPMRITCLMVSAYSRRCW